jgi:glycyl-tRNA synthetase
LRWYQGLGIKKEHLRVIEVPENKRAHYAKRQIDIEYQFPFGSPRCSSGEAGWKEIEGVHYRGDFDLSNHSKHSGKDLKYYNEETKEKYFPHIIETSVGVERTFLAFLCEAFEEVKGGRTKTTKAVKEEEIVLRLNKKLTPVKVAVLPLVKNKPELVQKAKDVFKKLKPYFVCQYDELGSIGRRYRRQDEIGTLYCLTIDFDSLKNDDLTIRDRDTMKQERVKIKDVYPRLSALLSA